MGIEKTLQERIIQKCHTAIRQRQQNEALGIPQQLLNQEEINLTQQQFLKKNLPGQQELIRRRNIKFQKEMLMEEEEEIKKLDILVERKKKLLQKQENQRNRKNRANINTPIYQKCIKLLHMDCPVTMLAERMGLSQTMAKKLKLDYMQTGTLGSTANLLKNCRVDDRMNPDYSAHTHENLKRIKFIMEKILNQRIPKTLTEIQAILQRYGIKRSTASIKRYVDQIRGKDDETGNNPEIGQREMDELRRMQHGSSYSPNYGAYNK